MSIPHVSVSERIQKFRELAASNNEGGKKSVKLPAGLQEGAVRTTINAFERLKKENEKAETVRPIKATLKPKEKAPAVLKAPQDEAALDAELQIEPQALECIIVKTKAVVISSPPGPVREPIALNLPKLREGSLEAPEYPVAPLIHKQKAKVEPVLLEQINDILDEKDDAGRFKRSGKYYIALGDSEKLPLCWMPFKGEELQRKERKEVIKALEFVLGAMNESYDKGVSEIRSKIYNDNEGLNRILDKIIDRDWCKAILMQKKQTAIRRALIVFLHRFTYDGPFKEAKQLYQFIQTSRPALNKLTDLLTAFQIQAVSREAQAIIEKGINSVTTVELPEEHQRVAKKILDACSPRLKELIEDRSRKRNNSVVENKALRPGFLQLSAGEKERVVKSLGIASVYTALNGDEAADFVVRCITRPEVLIGCYDEHSLTMPKNTLKKCEISLKEYIDFQQKWLDSKKRLRKFIKEGLIGVSALTGRDKSERQPKAFEAYKKGDWRECLRVVFHTGTPNMEFAALIKDVFKRAHQRLAENGCPKECLDRFAGSFAAACESPDKWQELDLLLKGLLKEFQRLGRG